MAAAPMLSLAGGIGPTLARAATEERPPNFVVIFTDDQGYADVGVYGAQGFETPYLDAMARGGARFTDFYVAQPVCSASRAALLTGCYANRVSIIGALDHNARHGLHEDEITIAAMLKQRGYATAIYGKWHLGHHPPFLPTRHGFDEYYGIPYSNDMWPFHPERPDGYPPLPLFEGEEVIEHNPDQSRFTTDLTTRAVDFIQRNKDNPFFLYVPHPMPHVPLFVSEKFEGKSEQGLYGDVIMEIDWSTGQIMQALRDHGLEENTLVIFTSDNGPWLSYGDHAGSAYPLREGKGTTWDGGTRVPCIMSWPGVIPENTVCREPAMTIDFLPTFAKLADAPLPKAPIDGQNIMPLLRDPENAESPHEALYFYWGRNLQAVRAGRWKLNFPHRYRTLDGRPGGTGGIPVSYSHRDTPHTLYDLHTDPEESTNLYHHRPNIARWLEDQAERIRVELGDGERQGAAVRPAGRLESSG